MSIVERFEKFSGKKAKREAAADTVVTDGAVQ